MTSFSTIRTWPGRWLSEVSRDVRGANQGVLRMGLILTLVTVAVIASGWPGGHLVQRVLFYVLGALPVLCVSMGLVVGELIHSRSDRRGERRADDREIRALRAKIAEDSGAAPHPEVAEAAARRAASSKRRALARAVSIPSRPVFTLRGGQAPFRRGHLGLR
jgi:hypothetical protein